MKKKMKTLRRAPGRETSTRIDTNAYTSSDVARIVDFLDRYMAGDKYAHIIWGGVRGNAPGTETVYPAGFIRTKWFEAQEPDLLKFAKSDLPILITGESGSGKTELSYFFHLNSSVTKSNKEGFVRYGLNQIDDNLATSMLFGHTKGAFTGADRDRKGLVEAANGGTLFLDEIDKPSGSVHQRLLQLLAERTYFKLGEDEQRSANCRLIFATNADLPIKVAKGEFLPDLYYRFPVPIHIPPFKSYKENEKIACFTQLLGNWKTGEKKSDLRKEDLEDFLKSKCELLLKNREILDLWARCEWGGGLHTFITYVKTSLLLGDPHWKTDVLAIIERDVQIKGETRQVGTTDDSASPDSPFLKIDAPVNERDLHRSYAESLLRHEGGVKEHAARLGNLDVRTLNKWLEDSKK